MGQAGNRLRLLGFVFIFINITMIASGGVSNCSFEQQDDTLILSNDLCRIVWNKTSLGWSGQYQTNVNNNWLTLAQDDAKTHAAYGIVFQGPSNRSHRAFQASGAVISGLPPANSIPKVLINSPDEIKIQWSFDIDDKQENKWSIQSTYTIKKDDYHIGEEVSFHAPIYTKVRYERGWQTRNIKDDFYEGVVHCITHSGWIIESGSFIALATQKPNGWDATTGGGGFVRYDEGFKREQDGYFKPDGENVYYNIFHRVPPTIEKNSWVDTRYFDTYTLKHTLIMYPGSFFDREAIDYLYKLQPLEKLPLRYTWKTFMDKQVEGLKNTPERFEDHGDWGHNELGWFNGFNDPLCTPKTTFMQMERQALDWGGNWDLWQAIALREYSERYGDKWAMTRADKIINGVKKELWQIDDSTTPCDGAFWMFRPRTIQEYQERRATKPIGEKGGSIHKGTDLWICDSGKISYLLCDLYEQTGDEELLKKAIRAADFLLRLQNNDGNLRAGRIHVSGATAYPANLASNSCAIMLWSRLYEITHDEKLKRAAIKCADYTIKNWLNGKVWKMYGGEWDVPGNASSSSANYATWGFAALYRATKYKPALEAVKRSADWQLTLQALFDTHHGFYAPKMYWRGRDARTTGGFTQGTQNEGYGYLLWSRPEAPYAQYLAWKVTGDKAYLGSSIAYLKWMMHMQHNCTYDWRFHGGSSEGIQWATDNLNGFGTVYIGEAIGCDLTIFALMEDGIIKE